MANARGGSAAVKPETAVNRKSDRELVLSTNVRCTILHRLRSMEQARVNSY